MKLYLSSKKLGEYPEKLIELLGPNKKCGLIILNAGDVNNARTKKNIDYLKTLNLTSEVLDLRKYFNKQEELKRVVNKFDFVWVRGGNIFKLQQAFEKSGFSKIIKELKNDLVYIGESAGSTIAGPTLKNLEIVDEIPKDYNSSKDGLGLIDYIIIPHYKSNHPESSLVDKLIKKLEYKNIKYTPLRDGEVIIVQQ